MEGEKKKDEPGNPAAGPPGAAQAAGGGSKVGGKYVPPSMRDGAARGKGETMKSTRGNVQTENDTCEIIINSFVYVWYYRSV